jgi:hypothetical protein
VIPWITGIVTGLLVFSVPYVATNALADPSPELRAIRAGDGLAMLLRDDEARILILNTGDPQEAIAALGRLSGPLDADVTTLLSAADDALVAALYEVLLRTSPGQVILLGVPGADPTWTALEAECKRRGIALDYVSGSARVSTTRLQLVLDGPSLDGEGSAMVTILRGATGVAVAFGTPPPSRQGHVLVTMDGTAEGFAAIVTPREGRGAAARIVIGRRDRVRIVLEQDEVRVFGGSLRDPAPPATPTTGGE